MSNTRFKTLSMAALIALAVGSSFSGAMAQTAGGPSGDGGPGGSFGYDPTPAIQASTVPGGPSRQPQLQETARFCGYELFRGQFCETRTTRR
jgi:hypothetical protein